MSREEREERTSYGRRAATHTSGFERTAFLVPDGYTTYKLETQGVKRLDIINYRVGQGNPCADPGTLHPERTFFIHRGIGPSEDSYVCLAKTYKEACPICEYRAKMVKRSDTDPKLLKDLEPKERQLWWVMDLSDTGKGWQLWEISYHLFGKLLDKRVRERDADEPYDMFSSATKGMTLKLGCTEKALPGTSFIEVTTIDFKPRTEPYDKALYDTLPCLDDLIIKTPYEKLKAVFLQTPEAGTAEEEPALARPAGGAKRPPAPAPDEDELPPPKPKAKAPPPPADEDEAPPPKPKAKATPVPVADDDWDDAPAPKPKAKAPPVEEEYEEPPPKPKAKPVPAAEVEDEAPPPKPKAKPAPAPAANGDDWDDWDNPPPAAAPKPKARPVAPVADED
jgi:hypothetical protein